MEHENRWTARRRAPGWIRALESRDLHAVALRLRRLGQESDLSPRQEWLFTMAVNELEYRYRAAVRLRSGSLCVCELCLPPFQFDDDESDSW